MMWKPCSIRMGLRRCLVDPMSVVAALPRHPASSLFPTVNQSSFFLAFSRTHTARALRKGGSASKLKAQVAATTSTELQESENDLLTHLPNFAIGTVMGSASNYVRVEVLTRGRTIISDISDAIAHSSGPSSSSQSVPSTHSADTAPPLHASSHPSTDQALSTPSSKFSNGSSTPSSSSSLVDEEPPVRRLLLCNIRGLLKKMQRSVLVGDKVGLVGIDWRQGRAIVEDVLPRRSELQDPAVANVDHLLLLFALDRPAMEEQQLSRFLISAEAAGIPFTLVLNKADLVDPELVRRRVAQVTSWGYPPIVLSCEEGVGIGAVAAVLPGRTSVVAGPSGAGKSSLINALRLGRHRPDLQPLPATAAPGEWRDLLQPMISRAVLSSAVSSYPAVAPIRNPTAGSEPWQDSNHASNSSSSTGMNSSSSPADQDPHQSSSHPDSGSESVPRSIHPESASVNDGSANGVDFRSSSKQDTDVMFDFDQYDREEGGSDDDSPEGEDRNGSSSSRRFIDSGVKFLAVGDVSKIGRGKHTTTSVTLIRLIGGGCVADTPGFGLPTMDRIPATELNHHFPEFQAAVSAQPCRFNNCKHVNEPGCSVTSAMFERHPIYLKFLAEIRERETRDVKVLQLGKRERQGTTKLKAGKGGTMREEAKLDMRKHRLVTRQQRRHGVMYTLDDQDEESTGRR